MLSQSLRRGLFSPTYRIDSVSLAVDPRTRYSGRQAAQKSCDRLNGIEAEKQTDGRTRNPKKWYAVGYADRMTTLVSNTFQKNPIHYHGYLGELLKQTKEIMEGGYISEVIVAVIWQGQLSRSDAVDNPNVLPIHHVFADGRIS